MNKPTNKTHYALIVTLSLSPAISLAKEKVPKCYGVNNWATQTSTTLMVNEGLLKDSGDIYSNGKSIKTSLLESKKIGIDKDPEANHANLYRQIQKIELKNQTGKNFELITISEASDLECSMSTPTVILISPELKILSEGDSYLQLQKSGLIPKITKPNTNQ